MSGEQVMSSDKSERHRPWREQGLTYFEWCMRQAREENRRRFSMADAYLPKPVAERHPPQPAQSRRHYIAERLAGGCVVFWLGKMEPISTAS
jgi:hypothetical protein